MLSREDWMYIKAQIQRGVYQKDIAQALGVSVRRVMWRGGPPSGKRLRARRSILDPSRPTSTSCWPRGCGSGPIRSTPTRGLTNHGVSSFLNWAEIFEDPVLATAILDLLLHHTTVVHIKGESWRLKERRRTGLLPAARSQEPSSQDQTQEGGERSS